MKIKVNELRMVKAPYKRFEYPIEKGVPMPPAAIGGYKYPFGMMEVGDSFPILEPDMEQLKKIRSAACIYGKNNGRQFSIKKDPEAPGSWRCWRKS